MTNFRAAAALLLASASLALPALAQPASPPPAATGPRAMPLQPPMHGEGGGPWQGRRAFATMSEAGRKTMFDAMRAGGDRREDHAAVKAARDRMLAVLDADRLDTSALKRAMDEERAAANAARDRVQTAMFAGFTKLSAADRKAFVAESRAMKTRMEARVRDWRGRRGAPDDVPPPPPMLP